MLNSWVRLSIVGAHRHVGPSDVDRGRADRGRGDRKRRQQQRIAPFERAIDGSRELGPEPHRADVVLGEDVAPHLEPQPDPGRIEVGVLGQPARVVARGFRQADVQVHVRRDRRILDRDLAQRVAGFADPGQRLFETGARFGLEPIEEVGPRDAERERRRLPARPRARSIPFIAWNSRAASATDRASGPT